MKQHHGFSLLELSIVLVIIGLIAGGIVAGSSMIRAAELRSLITEQERYKTAVYTFRDKYLGLPGDLKNATQFWGRLSTASTCLTNSSAAVAPEGVCDGNGDNQIGNPTAANTTAETWQFWRQLSNSGLVAGSFSGLSGSTAAYSYVKGFNTPSPKLSNGVWEVLWRDATSVSSRSYDINYGNFFHFGLYREDSSIGFGSTIGVIKPEEAWSIDKKLDDGKPASGQVTANVFSNNCTTVNGGTHTATNFDSEYNLAQADYSCGLYFRNAF